MTETDGIRLVCFDLGDVLIRLCRGWGHACEAAGLSVRPRDLDDAGRGAMHALIHGSEIGDLDQAQFAAGAAELLGLDPDHVLAISDAYLLGPYPEAARMLEDLHDAGVATACLSNTNAAHWRLMTDPDHRCYLPLDRMTYRFASHLVGVRKPDEAIYRHVEREAGLPAQSILFFDNLEENVDAARRCGWHAELIDPTGDPVGQARSRLSRYAMGRDGTFDPQAK